MAKTPSAGAPERLTLQHVADEAGVSRATASLVLRDSDLVADGTRRRVREAVERLGYIYNRGAANLRAHQSKVAGIAVGDIANPFFAELVVGLEAALDDAGYIAFLANTSDSHQRQTRFLQRMREQHVDGVVLCPAAASPKRFAEDLRQWGLPCVQALRHTTTHGIDYAGPDYAHGVELAIEHLVRLGHRRIAFIGGNVQHSATAERHTGFVTAMRRHQLTPDLLIKTALTRQAGLEALQDLLMCPDPPSAAVCFNDIVAFGVMLGIGASGLTIGSDFAVIGMDDVPEAALTVPALTTVATSPREVGREAARLLLARIADPERAPERSISGCRLVIRASCGYNNRRIDHSESLATS